jgi:serine/threonine-protein kinase HipA
MNGEHIGDWSVGPGGDELRYAATWLHSPQARPLSLSLPFTPGNQPHRGDLVRAYFDNLLPDSKPLRDRLARRYRAGSTDAFDLLAEAGRDCVGALQIVPERQDPGNGRAVHGRPLNDEEVAEELRSVTAPFSDQRGDHEDGLRLSIAGAQEKTALLWYQDKWWLPSGATPTTHILKLPLGVVGNLKLDMRHSIENEWLCAQILAAYGLPAARCALLTFEDQRVLAVERFDRIWSPDNSWLIRLPQEDLCQATGTPTDAKYEADGGPGIDTILGLLNSSRRRELDRANFFLAQFLFWLLRAPDGHAKNFSIALHEGGSFSMTPLYDVLSAYPVLGKGAGQIAPQRVKMAMALRSKGTHWRMQEILWRHWVTVGERNGVTAPSGNDVTTLLSDLVARTPQVVRTVSSALPANFPAAVADSMLEGLTSAAKAAA